MDRCVLPRDFVGFLVLFVEILEKGWGAYWRGTEKSVDCWSRLVPKCGFKVPRHRSLFSSMMESYIATIALYIIDAFAFDERELELFMLPF